MARPRLLLSAVLAAGLASAATAAGPGLPSVSIEPVTARSLLSAPERDLRPQTRALFVDIERAGLTEAPSYRVGGMGEHATGKRARLSVPVGDTMLFAIGGKLTSGGRSGPADRGLAGLAGGKDSGKVYGAGVERRIGPVDVSATYQFSKVTAQHPDIDDAASINSGGRSHSLRATARIRFRN